MKDQIKDAITAYNSKSLGAWVGSQAITAVLAVVLLAVGAIVAFQVISNIDKSGFPTEANTTLTNLETATQNAWAIGNLVPMVVFAVIIVGVVMGLIAVRGRGGTFLEWAANNSPSTRLTALLYNRSTGGWTGQMIVGAITTVIILAIGAVIAFKVITSYGKEVDGVGQGSAAYNSTYDALITGTQSAWAIGNLIPLIVFAVIIVGVVMGLLASGRGR